MYIITSSGGAWTIIKEQYYSVIVNYWNSQKFRGGHDPYWPGRSSATDYENHRVYTFVAGSI
jgi:hypothetical protein